MIVSTLVANHFEYPNREALPEYILVILDHYDSHTVGVSIGSQIPIAKCHRTEKKKIPTLKIFPNLSIWYKLQAATDKQRQLRNDKKSAGPLSVPTQGGGRAGRKG